jgi:integrase
MTRTLRATYPEDFLSLEEWHKLLKAAQSPREAAILWLLGGAGLRASEVAALRVEHIDPAGGYFHVVNGKGGKQRTSILPKPVLEALGVYLNDWSDEYVFQSRDHGHISTRQVQRLLDVVAERAGLQETR